MLQGPPHLYSYRCVDPFTNTHPCLFAPPIGCHIRSPYSAHNNQNFIRTFFPQQNKHQDLTDRPSSISSHSNTYEHSRKRPLIDIKNSSLGHLHPKKLENLATISRSLPVCDSCLVCLSFFFNLPSLTELTFGIPIWKQNDGG